MIELAEDPIVLARLCVEQWKLIQRFTRTIEMIPEPDRNRIASQIRYSEIQLKSIAAEAGLTLVTFDGEEYGPGCPASADNLEDFVSEDGLVVAKTLEPAVVRDMRIILSGRVLLAAQN